MRAFVGLLISAVLASSAAFAEPPAPTPAVPTGAIPAKAPATGAKTVEGVTVTGGILPKTECSPRDARCINLVVAELKRLYPEKLKRLCFQRQMRAMRDTTLFGDADPGGTRPTQTGVTFTPAAPLAVACAPDAK
jgi:hypothetical protein